jgi:hypothetical protein
MGKKISYSNGMRMHSKTRCEQRYGISMNRNLRMKILECVHTGKTNFVTRLSTSRTLFEIEIDGKQLYFIYCSNVKDILTFLPENDHKVLEYRKSKKS